MFMYDFDTLADKFDNDILPFCRSHNYGLHDIFDYSRRHSPQMYLVLSRLWSFERGKAFLRSRFKDKRF